MQSAWRIVSVLELLKVARHADCWTLPRTVKGASNASLTAASRQRGSSSPVRSSLYCTCPSSCVSALDLPPSVQHTLPDVGAMASAAFCSTLHAALKHCSCMPGPKASTPLLLRPMSRATFPAILGPPPWCSGGEPFLVVLQGTSQWCHTPLSHPLLPDKIEVDICREIQQPNPAQRPGPCFLGHFSQEKGGRVLHQARPGTFNGFLSARTRMLLHMPGTQQDFVRERLCRSLLLRRCRYCTQANVGKTSLQTDTW